jgi:hypothetical protein
MRTEKFRNVLWMTARQAGFSPEEGNLLTNQALSLGESISRWTDRLYQQEDWPEWSKTVIATPDVNHIAPYDVTLASGTGTVLARIARTIHVYLVDPNTTDTPIITDHRLTDVGVHCGYDHGSTVWIRYIEPSPSFTAEQWAVNITYSKNDSTYSFASGECYRSKVNNNIGNDPSVTGSPVTIPSAVTQQFMPPTLGTAEQDKIIYVDISHYQGSVPTPGSPPPAVPDPPPIASVFYVPVLSNTGVLLGSATHSVTGSQALDVIGADLASQLSTALGVGWTVAYDAASKTLRIRNGSDFILNSAANFPYWLAAVGPSSSPKLLVLTQIQPYIAFTPPTGVTPQILVVTFSQQQLVPGSLYTFAFSSATPPGEEHAVTYQSNVADGIGDILGGIANAIIAAALTDPFFNGISVSVDLVGNTITIRSGRVIAVDPTLLSPSPYWELLLFPQALVNAVVRGASADFLAEWGEIQSGLAVGQGVGVQQEEPNARGDFEATPNAPLTNQQEPNSRYKIKR